MQVILRILSLSQNTVRNILFCVSDSEYFRAIQKYSGNEHNVTLMTVMNVTFSGTEWPSLLYQSRQHLNWITDLL